MNDASLHPVTGDAKEVQSLLVPWLADRSSRPLTVRTSGSSGEPKDVALSPAAVVASAEATLRRLGGPGQWTLALPPHYVAGLQVVVRSVVAGTSPVVLGEHQGLPEATAALTAQRRYLAIVPTQLHRWLADPRAAAALAAYDAVLLGGAAADEALLARAREDDVRVVPTYGMSETCGGCVYDGVPLDGVAVALGQGGEIRVAGPTLFDGYVGRPDLTAEILRDGWLHTPDLGRFDDDGRLEVLGRADDVVVSGGVNVALPAVERRVAAMPGIAQAAVLGRPDPEWGTSVVAVVVADTVPDLAAIRDFVSEVHPRSWSPRELHARDSLPMLESGKVDRQALLRLLGGARDA